MQCEFCVKRFYGIQELATYLFHLIIHHSEKFINLKPNYQTGINYLETEY